MEKYDFSFQDEKQLSKDKNYVELQAGKGKKDNSSIFINAIEFSYIEGLIWDKYREFDVRAKMKITVSDWDRICKGFEVSIQELEDYRAGDDLKDILKFSLFRATNPLTNIDQQINEIKSFIINLSAWLNVKMKEEKHISIFKNFL